MAELESLDIVCKELNKKYKGDYIHSGYSDFKFDRIPFSSPKLNFMTYGGVPRGYVTEFSGGENGGKALSLDCEILTPNGYVPMREIKVGSTIISGRGEKTTVCGVYPQGVKPMYRITFSDHTTIDCSDNHLWEVNYHTSHGIKSKVMSVTELIDLYKKPKSNGYFYPYSIPTPIISDIDCGKSLDVDPYLLGVLLGDGGLTDLGINISISENDIFTKVSNLVSDWGMILKSRCEGTYDYRISHKDSNNKYSKNGKTLKQHLKSLDVCTKSTHKHIPRQYLFTSVENRVKLLQGLFDADGYIKKSGASIFYTCSEQLSNDFSFLVRSLGGIDFVTTKQGKYKDDGKEIVCNTCFVHTIVFKNGIIPCSSEKHLQRYKSDRHSYYRKIVNIERIDDCECQCIKVEDDCHTFIVENEIVTHNTTTVLDICGNAQKIFKEENPNDPQRVLFVDIENTFNVNWAQKLGVDTDSIILISPTNQYAEEIFNDVIRLVNTGKIGLVVLDSIAMLMTSAEFDEDIEKKQYGGVSMALTKFSKKMAQLCAKYNCTLIGINQLRENIGSMYGGTVTPGGKCWKHACILRMSFARGRFIDDKNKEVNNGESNPFGNIVNVAIEKTKCCAPNRKGGHYTLRYDRGIDAISDLIDLGISFGFIQQKGAWYYVVDETTGELMEFNDKEMKFQGAAKLYDDITNNTELYEWLTSRMNDYIYNKK